LVLTVDSGTAVACRFVASARGPTREPGADQSGPRSAARS